ncbi:MAG TPA: alpha/beta hydrolase-fold protein [Gemmatimonadaceae bacterium]|nr:alpha/beta hydrolase-fold protein [Gemmatimonadaceae bacterium]
MRHIAFGLFLVLAAPPPGLTAQAAKSGAITIGATDSVWSATLKENRKFLVYTPPSYSDTTYLPKRYPVLYLLDGDAHFHSVTGLLQILGTGINGTFVLPEMIVVAIPNTNRTRDMTPTHTDRDPEGKPQPALAGSGGMANFLTFIKTELIPRIERDYRTAPYRVFVGHSLGGITTINALYTMPDAFNAYVAIDPSLWWDNRVLLKQARERFSKPGLAGRTLFVAQANTITPGDTTINVHFNSIIQFNSILETFNQSGLRYSYRYYSHDSHGSVPMIAEYDALRFIFDAYDVSLAEAIERPEYLAEHFTRVSAAMGYKVEPPEGMVDLLGQVALGRDTTAALKLFEMNATLYPTSANAIASLGDVWLAKKDTTKAVGYYEKALAMRPGLKRPKEMLQKLKRGP